MKTTTYCTPAKTRVFGFTLIELMIVVLIMSILGAIAYPGYRNYVLRAARSEGKASLVTVASKQEQFFQNNKTYTTDISGDLNEATMSETGKYTITAAADAGCTIATCYLLTATRAGGQTDDSDCGDFTLNSAGTKGVLNATKSASECW